MEETERIKQALKEMISLPGISGYETPEADKIEEIWRPLTDEMMRSKAGSLYGVKKGSITKSGGKGKKVLIAVHMDGIGMVVHKIVKEFIYFAEIGGIDPRILPGQFVTIHAKDGDIRGLIAQPGDNVLSKSFAKKPIPMEELVIDTGFDEKEVAKRIRVGDIISFANPPVEMPDDCVAGHSLDNRASAAALTQCLVELQRYQHQWDVYAAATVQEEVSFLGGKTAPYDIQPDIAIAVDVTFASGPNSSDWRTKALESGPSIGKGMNIHPALFTAFESLAKELEIPYTTDFSPSMSGTDGDPMQVAVGGFPTLVISIPLRYMHTPVEVISMKDIMRTGRLLSAFIARLDDNFMKKLEWEA